MNDKEKLIKEMTKEINKKYPQWLDISRSNLALNEFLSRYLRQKFRDLIIVNKNKLKEQLDVEDYPPYHNDDFNPNAMFVTGLRVRQYFDKLTIASVDIDILKDRVKDGFIYNLEECDFE